MEFLYSNATPRYKGMSAQPRVSNGFLSGLFGNLLGGAAPTYRTVDGRRVSAQPSSSWWSVLSQAPSYKTVRNATVPAAPAQEVVQRCDESSADNGELDPEQTCVCAPADATQIVILE